MKNMKDEIRAVANAFINEPDIDILYIKNDGIKARIKTSLGYATVEEIDDTIFVEVKVKKHDIIYMHFCHQGVDEAIGFIKEKLINERKNKSSTISMG